MRLHRLVGPDLGRIFRGETVSGLSEWQLLERYLDRRDEAAFEALVSRHGPMVLGVCRRMLDNTDDVEDAFQATFLVLVRRARQLGPRDAIGPWLYGVAARVALRVRSQLARRRRHEPIAGEFPIVAPVRGELDPDLGEVLDQELSRLPSKYRSPLVLCYLEGRTHEEAARELHWPVGTVKGRLARARDLLRARLARRGLAPTTGILATLAATDASAGLERPLIERTVSSSLKLATGQSLAQVASHPITSLVEGALAAMILSKLKWAGLSVLVAGLALTSAGVMARQDAPSNADPPTTAVKAVVRTSDGDEEPQNAGSPPQKNNTATLEPNAEKRGQPKKKITSRDTDPGSADDARQELIQAARSAYRSTWEAFGSGHASAEQVYQASQKWMEAQEQDLGGSEVKVVFANAHLERMRELLRIHPDRPGSPSKPAELARIKAYVAEARFLVAQAKTRPSVKDVPAHEGGWTGEGRDKDPRSRKVLAKLEEPISMSFANETPLDDVLKYIKQATTTRDYGGIPIYVDPLGLQEAERSLTSTILIDLEGIPLRRTLQLLLSQLGLVYFVEDGMIVITSEESEQGGLPPSMRQQTPILARAAKAERGELTRAEMEELIELFKVRATVMNYAAGNGAVTPESESESEPKRDREQMNQLLKELRELVEQLKAERQPKKAPAEKTEEAPQRSGNLKSKRAVQ
jgi:RNA polymerase sigma factor (sigma-70 family)